jgi:putative oxidoreductase
MARAFLAGRILVGCFYLQNAFDHFANVGRMARYTAAHGVPAPELAVIVSGLLLLVAGLSFLLGAYPWLGVAAAALFLVPVTLIMHSRPFDAVNFGKNIALLGSSLMFLAVPRPWPYSIERRLHLPVRAPG